MKLRSSSTRRRTSFPDLNTKTPRKSTADITSVVSKALTNPLVLDSIFASIDTTDLKTARLVCRNWSDVGAGVLGKRAVLDVNKVFRNKGSKSVHDKLTRRLIIRDHFHHSGKRINDVNTMTKIFTHLAPNVSQFTQEIEFCVTLKKFETAFLNGLRTLESTRIQHISILVNSTHPNVDNCRIQGLQELPIQEKLTSLKFQLAPRIYHGIHAFQPLLQVLLDSAPKLTSLDVAAAFCPSLEGCKNLKVLKFCFENCIHVACPHFDLATVMSMLKAVKDSLVELELRYDVVGTVGIIRDEVKIQNSNVPVMSNLVSLTIDRLDVYQIQDFFDEEHLPKLKNFSLREDPFLKLSTHLDLWKRHRGVQSFALETRYNYMAIKKDGEKIVQLFPAVQKLDLTLIAYGDFVNDVMRPFEPWDLEEVKLGLRFVCIASHMVELLRIMAIWTAVKSVHFEHTFMEEDDFSSCIQDIILYSRGFKRVEISGTVVPEIVEVMRPIFEASGAPVDFKGGVRRN